MSAENLDQIVERVQKILALGRRGGTEAEAATAMMKANELLAKYNLDMAAVERGPTERNKVSRDTGMYVYQRSLWEAVARLNFCLCFRAVEIGEYRGRKKWRNRMYVVGRKVNTATTIAMASYLESAADRLCRERLEIKTHHAGTTSGNMHQQFFSGWAISFRAGVADRLIEKIDERHAENAKAENRRRRAEERSREGASTARGLTLSIYKSQEEDANIDFLHGEGTAAEWAAQRAEAAAERAADDAEFARWAKENPEDAKDFSKRRRKWMDLGYTFRVGRSSSRDRKRGPGYWDGHEAGDALGIDPQADAKTAGRIA